MFLNSKKGSGYGNIFANKSKVDCYSLSVRNSDHFNFSDFPIYPVPYVEHLLGSIESSKSHKNYECKGSEFF